MERAYFISLLFLFYIVLVIIIFHRFSSPEVIGGVSGALSQAPALILAPLSKVNQ